MRLNISIEIPEFGNSEQTLYLRELREKIRKFHDNLYGFGDPSNSKSSAIDLSCDTDDDDNVSIVVEEADYPAITGDYFATNRKLALGELTSIFGYAIAANCGEPLAAFPNIPITPLFGEMFVDPDSEDKTPQSTYYIAQGNNPWEHSMEDVPEDQQHIVLDFIVPKMDATISTILPTIFDKNPRLVETDTTDVYLTEEWFSGEPKLVCSFNLYADSSEDAIEHSAKMGQAFIEEIRDKLIEKK